MAQLNVTPVAIPARGKAALERDLPLVLRDRSLADAGWSRLDDLTLCIPLWSLGGDFYLLRLQFHCYPEWPPGTLFVNPITRDYRFPDDKRWLPTIEAPHLRVHADYANSKKQLICNSTTCEFYEVRHGLDDQNHIWDEKQHNFNHTLFTITQALQSEHYKGRQS